MAKKKGNKLKKAGKFLLFVISILAAVALFFAFLAKLIPPSVSSTIAYCGLFFPYLLIANFVLTVVWLVVDFTWALLPVSVILLNVNNIDKHFQLRGIDKPEVCVNCLKVMSYNAKAFNIYDENQRSLNRQVTHFLQNEMPDILCIQEYSYDNTGKSGFNSTEAILNALNIKDNERTRKVFLPYRNKLGYQFGMAIFSRSGRTGMVPILFSLGISLVWFIISPIVLQLSCTIIDGKKQQHHRCSGQDAGKIDPDVRDHAGSALNKQLDGLIRHRRQQADK